MGLWRAQVGPRWVPGVLVTFLLVEFLGTGLSRYASLASATLYVVSFGALALLVWRTPDTTWATRATAPEDAALGPPTVAPLAGDR